MCDQFRDRIQELWAEGDRAVTADDKGSALEEMICFLFGTVPGIEITHRDRLNAAGSEEIDVSLWNDKLVDGLYFLINIILIECKNWSRPVGSDEVALFEGKLRRRGLQFGILVAANGITGDPVLRSNAHDIVGRALEDGRQIVVMTRRDIDALGGPDDLVKLIKKRLCELTVSGTVFLE